MLSSITAKFLAYLGGATSVGLAVLLIVAGFKIHALTADLSTANGQLATAYENLGTSRTNAATLQGSINTQNARVDGIALAAQAADASAKAGQAAHEAAAAAEDARGAALDKLAPLPAGADHCAAASQLIRDTLAAEHAK